MNEQQIAALYRQWGPVVYRRCLGVLRDREEARDATQHVFVQLLRHSQRFDGDPTAAIGWMQSVATNVSLSRLRDGRRHGSKLASLQEEPETAPAPDRALEQRQAVAKVLGGVDERSKDLAVSVLVGEQSHEATAARLGVSEKTVQRGLRQFLTRARRLLKGDEP